MKALSVALLLSLAATPAFAAPLPDIEKAIADPARPQDDRDADAHRAPAATLEFAGVKPGLVVGELYPCGGYFSHLLSDVVGPKGKIYGLETTRWKGCLEADQKAIARMPVKNMTVEAKDFGAFDLPEKVDLFWITQNYHDLHIKKYGDVDMAAFNRHVFDSLKPGGTYFIVDHAADAGIAEADIATLHRIPDSQVVREVTAAGFKLVEEKPLPNNPADDRKKPIFDPAVRGKTEQYLLKFVKP